MAAQFLTLMADLGEDAQQRLSGWYASLAQAGFWGTQTPRLPYHISVGKFPLVQEEAVLARMKQVSSQFARIPLHISHIGLFAGGKVLFCAPERTPQLDALHDACLGNMPQAHPWTPHVSLLQDEPEAICAALPIPLQSFCPFLGDIVRLHLCAFWPAREIASMELRR